MAHMLLSFPDEMEGNLAFKEKSTLNGILIG